eukprot:scaffold345280_cov22-Prasinocladus_malaysianus.AAC.1
MMGLMTDEEAEQVRNYCSMASTSAFMAKMKSIYDSEDEEEVAKRLKQLLDQTIKKLEDRISKDD